MNQKITLPKAARLMADASGLSLRQCESFLKGLAEIITESLSEGEYVKVRGLGTFRLTHVEARRSVNVTTGEPTEIAEHAKVVFIPSKEMAVRVNSPFEFFEAVELDDSVSEEELEAVEDTEVAELAEIGTLAEAEMLVETSAVEAAEIDETPEDPDEIEKEEEKISDPAEAPMEPKPKSRHRFGWGFIAGFAACLVAVALGLGFGIAYWWHRNNEVSENREFMALNETVFVTDEENPSPTDSVYKCNEERGVEINDKRAETSGETPGTGVAADVPTSPSDASADSSPVYDTIGKTRYLTTMAKDHYGDFNLWPYIYEENKAILGHPDRIRPGTRVVIPPLSKYGVSNNPADIENAKRLGAAIYARYQ